MTGTGVVRDDYLHMERLDEPATRAWIRTQGDRTRAVLDVPEVRRAVDRRLTELEPQVRLHDVQLRGGTLFYTRSDPGTEWAEIAAAQPGRPDRVVMPAGCTPSSLPIVAWSASPDGGLIAYQTAAPGAETGSLYVWDVGRGQTVDGPLGPCRYGTATWLGDREFLYVRVLAGGEGRALLVHPVCAPPDRDELLVTADRAPSSLVRVRAAAGGLTVAVVESTGFRDTPEVLLFDRRPGRRFRLRDRVPGLGTLADLTFVDELLVVLRATADDRREVVVRDRSGGQRRVPVPVIGVPQRVLPTTLADGRPGIAVLVAGPAGDELARVALDGGEPAGVRVHLPPATTVVAVTADPPAGSAVMTTGWDRHRAVHLLRPDGRLVPGPQERSTTNDRCAVREARTRAADGTEIGMTILEPYRDYAPTPTLLTCYGGFGISLSPQRSPFVLAWVGAGGRFVVVDVRGGDGPGRHEAGRRRLKEHVVDDFATAARWVAEQGLASAGSLGAIGASNGGMVAAAAAVRYPTLWGAVALTGAVLDMARFHRHGAGRYWVDEYGSPDDPGDLAALLRYSPFHRIRPGTDYPPMLVSYFENDDRVSPLHSVKFTARLQAAGPPDRHLLNPVPDGGHHLRAASATRRWDVDRLVFLGGALGLRFYNPPDHCRRTGGTR